MAVATVPLTKILTAQTTADVYAPFPPPSNGKFIESTVYVVWSAGASAGSVVIETAPYEGYTDTWANIATVAWSAEKKVNYVNVTGVFATVRVRIATTITGGTVDAYVIATN